MSTEENRPPEDTSVEIPEDAQIVTQIQWGWLWSSMPWLMILMALYIVGFVPDELSTIILSLIILVPRYLIWRRTALAITEDTLIYQRGGVIGSQRYQVPFSSITDVKARPGFFGRSLGYEAIDIMLDNGAVATLPYVPTLVKLEVNLKELLDKSEPNPEETLEDSEPDPKNDMKCPNCDQEIPDGSLFCGKCGSQIDTKNNGNSDQPNIQ